MATKRMFSNLVIDTDSFLELSCEAQLLYFHLGMKTDDDGFVAGAVRIARTAGISTDRIRELVQAGYLIEFPDSKVYVVTHHRINNTLQSDRYNRTIYTEEYNQLETASGKAYKKRELATANTEPEPNWNRSVSKTEPNRNQTGTEVFPQHNITEQNITEQRVSASNCKQLLDGDGGTETDTLRKDAAENNVLIKVDNMIKIIGTSAARRVFQAWITDNKRKDIYEYNSAWGKGQQ